MTSQGCNASVVSSQGESPRVAGPAGKNSLLSQCSVQSKKCSIFKGFVSPLELLATSPTKLKLFSMLFLQECHGALQAARGTRHGCEAQHGGKPM